MTDYSASPAAILLATHCLCCGRPLVDSQSVERGIGPICAQKYGYDLDVTAEAREEANALVYRIAAAQKQPYSVVAPLIDQLSALGFVTLVSRLLERLAPKPEKASIFLTTTIDERTGSPYFRLEAPYLAEATDRFRAIPGRYFRKVQEGSKVHAYNFVPASQKAALWDLLKAFYAGATAEGPKGTFTI